MPLITAEINDAANAAVVDLDFISLHTASPGTTGASEATGGGYARKALTWGSASGGVVTATEVTFDAAAATYTHVGYWSALSGGTFLGYAPLSAPVVLSATGQVKVTPSLTVTTP